MRPFAFLDAEDHLKLTACAAIFVCNVAGFAAFGLRFDWASAAVPAALWPLLMGLAWFYAVRRPDPRLHPVLKETAHLVMFTGLAAMLSYLAAGLDRPLIDPFLAAFDRALGFDWMAYVAFVNERSWLGSLSSLFYLSTLSQVAMAAIVLPLIGLSGRARELVLAVMIAALISIAISAVLPSAGALAHYRPDPGFYLVNGPVVDLAYKQTFYDMRALSIPLLSLTGAKGLIAFPSYHVALSMLIFLAFRGRPAWFWPMLAVNAVVILTTPVDGGHFLADALGGIVVAAVALPLAVALRRRLHAAPAPVPALAGASPL